MGALSGMSLSSDFTNDYFLALLAARKGLISEAQLEQAVSIRQCSYPTPRLLDVVSELGHLKA
jgi:hypothetical protein